VCCINWPSANPVVIGITEVCQPEHAEGDRFDCQCFDELNMTIKPAYCNILISITAIKSYL